MINTGAPAPQSSALVELSAFVESRRHAGDPRAEALRRGLLDLIPFTARRPHVAALLAALILGEHLTAQEVQP